MDDAVIREARKVGRRVFRICRGLVDVDDLQQEAYLWALRNRTLVEEWLTEARVGRAKLNTAMYRACLAYVTQTRLARSGGKAHDIYWYTPALLREVLPDVLAYEGWEYGEVVSNPGMDLGENFLATFTDIRSAFRQLHVNDQRLLRMVFVENMDAVDIGKVYSITDDSARNRTAKALERLVDRLGGSPPWWSGGRKAKSNAKAQSETRSQT